MCSEYIFDAGQRIFRRRDAAPEPHVTNDSECWIAQVIAAAKDLSSGSAELAGRVIDGRSAYHLGPHRSNLLRPLVALLDGPTLEVGSNYGALTRFLGERAPYVTAIERQPQRAATTGSRCRDLPNVEVYCDSFERFRTNAHFRLIIFVDTLAGTAASAMLARARDLLSPAGRVLIAASNRLRLPFSQDSGDRTGLRGLAEWQELLRGCGMEPDAILHPFPDHLHPALILTEAAFQDHRLNLAALLESCISGGNSSAPEEIPWGTLAANRLVPHLANSFCILARPRGAPGAGLRLSGLAYQYATRRLPAFRKQARIQEEQGKLMVRRSRLCPEASCHGKYKHQVEDEPYLSGPLYSDGLREALHRDHWNVDSIAAWAKPWLDLLCAQSSPGADGFPELLPNCLDCVPFNLVQVSGSELKAIDIEYACAGPVPLDFVAFRGLWLSLARIGSCAVSGDLHPWRLAELSFAVLEAAGIRVPPERQRSLMEREAGLQNAVAGMPREQVLGALQHRMLPVRRQAGSGIPEVVEAQLFWRSHAGYFNEHDTHRIQTMAAAERRTLRFHIAAGELAPVELRFDIADRPGIARLFAMRVLDNRQKVLWEWDGLAQTLQAATHVDMSCHPTGETATGTIVCIGSNDPILVLPISGEDLRPLQQGGYFEAEFAWIGAI